MVSTSGCFQKRGVVGIEFAAGLKFTWAGQRLGGKAGVEETKALEARATKAASRDFIALIHASWQIPRQVDS